MSVDSLLAYLYEIIENESRVLLEGGSSSRAGYKLEKAISLKMAEFCAKNKMDWVNVCPERYELDLDSLSGQKHQFDSVIQFKDTYLLGEIKRREKATKEQLLSFSARLMDYGLGEMKHPRNNFFRGLFISTAAVPDSSAAYAVGCGITPIAPCCPPVEYLLVKTSEDSPLHGHLSELKKELTTTWPLILVTARRDGHAIFQSYKEYLDLWKDEMKT